MNIKKETYLDGACMNSTMISMCNLRRNNQSNIQRLILYGLAVVTLNVCRQKSKLILFQTFWIHTVSCLLYKNKDKLFFFQISFNNILGETILFTVHFQAVISIMSLIIYLFHF